jgi:hypothetical protein
MSCGRVQRKWRGHSTGQKAGHPIGITKDLRIPRERRGLRGTSPRCLKSCYAFARLRQITALLVHDHGEGGLSRLHRLWSGHGPPDGANGDAQFGGALGLALTGREQLPQPPPRPAIQLRWPAGVLGELTELFASVLGSSRSTTHTGQCGPPGRARASTASARAAMASFPILVRDHHL